MYIFGLTILGNYTGLTTADEPTIYIPPGASGTSGASCAFIEVIKYKIKNFIIKWM